MTGVMGDRLWCPLTIPQRRHNCFDISLLVTWQVNIFSSLSSTSCHPVKIGLGSGFWVTGTFICTSSNRVNIDILYIELVLKSNTTTTKTYYKWATSDEDILSIRRETQTILLSLVIIGDSQEHICISNSEGFCSGFVYCELACIMALGEESRFSSGWATEATAKVETEAATWCSWEV